MNFQNIENDQYLTMESIAWKMLMGDISDKDSKQVKFFIQDDSPLEPENMFYDSLSGEFQILITIYMEMIFYSLWMENVSKNMDENGDIDNKKLESDFIPDFSEYSIDVMKSIFKNQFEKIGYIVFAREAHEFDMENYYCNIILEDTQEGKKYFRKNRKIIPDGKKYTFTIRTDHNKNQKKLIDFFAICKLPHTAVKIYFSRISVNE
jgi:hypothetical protein